MLDNYEEEDFEKLHSPDRHEDEWEYGDDDPYDYNDDSEFDDQIEN